MTTYIPSMSQYHFDGRVFRKRKWSPAPYLLTLFFFCCMSYSYSATPEQMPEQERVAFVSPADAEPPAAQVLPEATEYILSVNSSLGKADASAFARHIIDAAEVFKLDLSLLLAIITVESRFNPDAMSKAGAVGLTQVIPKWHGSKIKAARMVTDAYSLFEPKLNIYVGAGALSELLDSTANNVALSLSKYNGSAGDASRAYANRVIAEAKKARVYLNGSLQAKL